LKKKRGQSKKFKNFNFCVKKGSEPIFKAACSDPISPLIRKRRVGESGVLSGTAMLAQAAI